MAANFGPSRMRCVLYVIPFFFAIIVLCRRWSSRPGLFYVLQIFLWTASFRVNTEIVAWSTVRRILWRFLPCVRHAFFFNVKSCPGYVLKIYYCWRNCLWLAFRKQFAGKAYLKITYLRKRRCIGAVWKLDAAAYGLLPEKNLSEQRREPTTGRPVELALKGVLCTSLGSEGSLIHGFSPFIDPTAMPWWWASTRAKQLSMAAPVCGWYGCAHA